MKFILTGNDFERIRNLENLVNPDIKWLCQKIRSLNTELSKNDKEIDALNADLKSIKEEHKK